MHLENKGDEKVNSKEDAARITAENAHELRRGDVVSATREFTAGVDSIKVRPIGITSGKFIKWASWSGMGLHFVAEVSVKGEVHYVPRTHLFKGEWYGYDNGDV